MYIPQEIIRSKRNGQALSSNQIKHFVDGLVSGKFNDAQVGSMAMAIFQQGMNTQETIHLTQAMINSGKVITWPELDKPIVDKHSTGGVGDKVSFMLAAIVASCGAYVPMIAGRGLAHTGGTVDKLESIQGVNVQPSIESFKRITQDLGMAIISQTDDLAPADKRLYSIRDVTSTVESIPLITASILSKKLAAGLQALVMDIKVGNGAVMNNLNDAKLLAQSIVNVANGAGVKTQAIITDMNQVLGHSAGNAVEMIETVDYLTGDYRDPRLHEVTCQLAGAMLMNTQLASSYVEAKAKIENALASGKAAEKFNKMIAALGGPTDFIENPWRTMKKANIVNDIIATENGYIHSMEVRDIGMSIVGMKGGRIANGEPIDHAVGFDQILPIGTKVEKGTVIARLHANNEHDAIVAKEKFLRSVTIAEENVKQSPIIYSIINEE